MLHRQCVVQLRVYPRLPLLLQGRRYSTASATKPDQVTIPCKNNGFITLDIYRPSPPTQHEPVNDSILLYLPRGLIFKSEYSQLTQTSISSHSEIAATLANASSATVVQVNYRVSPDHRFPTAIHDVAVGYDWAVKHLSRKNLSIQGEEPNSNGGTDFDHLQSSQVQTQENDLQTRVGVCGELLGGTLALSLALSECRLPVPSNGGGFSNTGRVVAAAVNNPIVDWIFQPVKPTRSSDPTAKRKSSRRKQSSIADTEAEIPSSSPSSAPDNDPSTAPTMTALLAARKALFHPSRAADWFDPFASPVFFLRTPGVEVATAKSALPNSPPPSPIYPQDPPADLDPDMQDLSALPLPSQDLSSPSYAVLAADDTIDLPTHPPPDIPAPPPPPPPADPAAKPYKPRRSPLKYPPTAMLPVAFPSFRVSVAAGSALREQCGEMVALLRRALRRFEFSGPRGVKEEEWEVEWGEGGVARLEGGGEDKDAYLRERVALEVREPVAEAGWDREEAERIGRWFGEVFRQGD